MALSIHTFFFIKVIFFSFHFFFPIFFLNEWLKNLFFGHLFFKTALAILNSMESLNWMFLQVQIFISINM